MNLQLRFAQIEQLLNADKLEAAQQRLDDVAAEVPNLSLVPRIRAVIALRQNRYAVAEAQARQALSLDATDDLALRILAVILREQGHLLQAIPVIDEAIGLDPTDADHYAVKAGLLLRLDRYAESEHFARLGLALDPDHEDCRNLLGSALNMQGQREQAVAEVQQLLETNPVNPAAHANAGFLALHQNRIAEAKQHFVEALRLQPDHQGAQAGLAETIKAANPMYRGLLAWGVWLHDMGTRYRIALIVGLLVVVRLVPVLLPLYGLLLLWTWMTSPISTAYLALHRTGRYLVQTDDRPYAFAIIGCLVGLLFTVVLGLLMGASMWFAVAACAALATVGLQQIIDRERSAAALRVNGIWLSVLGLLAAVYCVAALQGTDPLLPVATLVVAAVLYSWLGPSLSRR